MTMGGADPEPTAATSVFDRAVRPPRPLDVELPRLRLLSRLDERWEHTVTVVCAGPGFGKTTMLAQAVRSNLLEPRGVDVWISCDASHQDAGRFAGAILHAIAPRSPDNTAVPVPGTPGVAEITDALIRIAPLEVCVLLDDVHELPVDSPGAELLRRLVRTLPATAHLVLSGRTAPDVPLARLEAAGEVLRLEEPELVFTDIEVTSLARRLGSHPRLARSLHGWPALVRLAFAAGPNAPAQFAREEILARLPDATRRTLAALAALGIATEKEVAAVAGTAVDLIDLAHRIPLVGVLDDGRFRAHDLWSGAVSRMLSPLERSGIRRRRPTSSLPVAIWPGPALSPARQATGRCSANSPSGWCTRRCRRCPSPLRSSGSSPFRLLSRTRPDSFCCGRRSATPPTTPIRASIGCSTGPGSGCAPPLIISVRWPWWDTR